MLWIGVACVVYSVLMILAQAAPAGFWSTMDKLLPALHQMAKAGAMNDYLLPTLVVGVVLLSVRKFYQ